MSFGDSMKKLIGIEEPEEEEVTEAEVTAAKERLEKEVPPAKRPQPQPAARPQAPAASAPARTQPSRFATTSTSAFKLLLIEPKTFEECPKLVDSLKAKRPVIINLERLETEVARKIFDFLSGATYALNGNVQKVANNIFVFAPANVDIAGGQSEQANSFEYTAGSASTANASSSPWR